MAASLIHLQSQAELNQYLSRKYRLPVEISEEGPLPRTRVYKPIRKLAKTGLTISLRELLHVVGSKTASLPSSYEDECLVTAHALLRSFDLRQKHLSFRDDIPSDFQTPRSQEVGVGVSCLIATKHLKMPLDTLEPIPKQGKRFDYHGRKVGLSCMLESKGTKYRANQAGQIADGLEKKNAHHEDGEYYDVELIASTYIGIHGEKPRILLADPIVALDEWLRSEQARTFSRLRHYTRVMQFIGATELARELYLESNEIKDFGITRRHRIRPKRDVPLPESRVTIGKEEFIGSYYDSPFPRRGRRYASFRKRKIRRDEFDPRITIFQGIRVERLQAIKEKEVEDLDDPVRPHLVVRATPSGSLASILEDGTVFFAELRG